MVFVGDPDLESSPFRFPADSALASHVMQLYGKRMNCVIGCCGKFQKLVVGRKSPAFHVFPKPAQITQGGPQGRIHQFRLPGLYRGTIHSDEHTPP
jgi:hypothetical protein